MLKTLLDIIQIRKELPDAIGYVTYGPTEFPIPKDLVLQNDVIDSKKSINLTYVRFDNFSNKVKRNVRILYNGSFSYEPSLEFYNRDAKVKYELNHIDKEILLSEVPPSESVSIGVFNASVDFEIIQVLDGDNQITPFMQKLAHSKRNPTSVFHYLVMSFMIVAVAMSAYVLYEQYEQKQQSNRIESMISGKSYCRVFELKNNIKNKQELESSFYKFDPYLQNLILNINKANSFDALLKSDEFFWCEQEKNR